MAIKMAVFLKQFSILALAIYLLAAIPTIESARVKQDVAMLPHGFKGRFATGVSQMGEL